MIKVVVFDLIFILVIYETQRECLLIRSNKMQQYASIYLLQNHSTCFGRLSHQSSGVHQTVTAANGTGHSIRATTKVVALIL